jgi:feruloyl esterase
VNLQRTLALFAAIASFCLPASATSCEGLAGLSLPNVSITSAKDMLPGGFAPDAGKPIENLPGFCRVEATLTPSPDSAIRIEVWMPASGWNGKFEGTGNGGYAGGLSYGALADGLRRGYAVANTDMGTSRIEMDNADAFIDHLERWTDWGWRATHEMTVAAKQIVRAFYGRAPERSYFSGCSTGGQQALMEAQRFPDDYDGIVAGAPAHNRTRLHMDILWNYAVAERTPADLIPAAKLPLVAEAVLKACPKAKAIASDTFLSYPESCRWQPDALLCPAGDAPNCVTAAQVATAKRFYGGPVNPVTGASIYPGLPRGSELAWDGATPKADRPPYDSLFKWALGPGWDWRSFDFNRDVAAVDGQLASTLNATNPDLSAFKAHGHKLILFHGWADWLVPPAESVNYYRAVLDAQASTAASHHESKEQETEAFFRFFLVPGMAHCAGGPGLNGLDALPSLELWVEKGVAPEEMVARRTEKDAVTMTRPVCPYPRIASYKGTGDASNAASFSCKNPGRNEGK